MLYLACTCTQELLQLLQALLVMSSFMLLLRRLLSPCRQDGGFC